MTSLGDSRGAPAEVSVVIPHYGDPAPTRALVDMLLARPGDVTLEVIVVDDCSPVPLEPVPGAEVVRRERNGGFGSAVNSGAARATSPLLLVLNSDLEVPDGFIRDLVSAARPWQPAVVGPAIMSPSGTHDHTGRHFPRVRHHVVEWLTPLARWRDTRPLHEAVGHDTRAKPGEVVSVDWLVGAALLISLEHFRAVGGFDERFYMNSEEVDLQRRLRERGLPSVYMGTVSVVHEGGGSSGDRGRRRQWVVDARFTYGSIWGGRRRLATGLLAATAVNLAVNVLRSLRSPDVQPWRTARSEAALVVQGYR